MTRKTGLQKRRDHRDKDSARVTATKAACIPSGKLKLRKLQQVEVYREKKARRHYQKMEALGAKRTKKLIRDVGGKTPMESLNAIGQYLEQVENGLQKGDRLARMARKSIPELERFYSCLQDYVRTTEGLLDRLWAYENGIDLDEIEQALEEHLESILGSIDEKKLGMVKRSAPASIEAEKELRNALRKRLIATRMQN